MEHLSRGEYGIYRRDVNAPKGTRWERVKPSLGGSKKWMRVLLNRVALGIPGESMVRKVTAAERKAARDAK